MKEDWAHGKSIALRGAHPGRATRRAAIAALKGR